MYQIKASLVLAAIQHSKQLRPFGTLFENCLQQGRILLHGMCLYTTSSSFPQQFINASLTMPVLTIKLDPFSLTLSQQGKPLPFILLDDTTITRSKKHPLDNYKEHLSLLKQLAWILGQSKSLKLTPCKSMLDSICKWTKSGAGYKQWG